MKNNFAVLVVDDNANFVNRIVDLLDDSTGHRKIHSASNSEEASNLLLSSDYDLVLLDINLPGKNGIEILKEIKKSGKSTDVIMITNHADGYYKEQCHQLGVTYFMDKSFDFGFIPGIVEELESRKKFTGNYSF